MSSQWVRRYQDAYSYSLLFVCHLGTGQAFLWGSDHFLCMPTACIALWLWGEMGKGGGWEKGLTFYIHSPSTSIVIGITQPAGDLQASVYNIQVHIHLHAHTP